MLTGHACNGVGHTLETSVNSRGVSRGVSYPINFFALSSVVHKVTLAVVGFGKRRAGKGLPTRMRI
jgi:hypothetical protein